MTWFEVNAQWLADTSGNRKGRRFSLGLEKNFHLGRHVMVAPHVTAHWLDKKYVDYYYGVRANEVMAARAAYVGQSGVNLDVAVTSLAKGIKDSSLVDRSSTNRVILGYMYRF